MIAGRATSAWFANTFPASVVSKVERAVDGRAERKEGEKC